MKSNSYFRVKTSTPTLELEASGPNSLAALMGRFRNEGQKEDYCLRAKPDTAGLSNNSLLGSRYGDVYDQNTRNFQTINKENMWNNTPNQGESRFKQLTPRRQQLFEENKRQRSHSKSPINSNYFPDNSIKFQDTNKFTFKAKEGKTLGNLIQLAENYKNQAMKITSPNKVYIKKQSCNENPYFNKPEDKKLSIELEEEDLQKQVSLLKDNLVNIALQSLPSEAVYSAIHIQIQDFLSRLMPSRNTISKQTEIKKVETGGVQGSQGMPMNFSFDVSYNDFSKGVGDFSSSEKIQSSIEQQNGMILRHQQKQEFLICEPEQSGQVTKLLSSKTQQTLRQL